MQYFKGHEMTLGKANNRKYNLLVSVVLKSFKNYQGSVCTTQLYRSSNL
jgi:hypothetical protein